MAEKFNLCGYGNPASSNSQHVWDYISTVPSLVLRPLRDFISQPWRKIGRKPGIITTAMVDPVSTI